MGSAIVVWRRATRLLLVTRRSYNPSDRANTAQSSDNECVGAVPSSRQDHRTVVALFLCAALSSPGQTFVLALYLEPIMAAVGASRPAVSMWYAVATFLAAAALLPFGHLADRLSTRRFLLIVVATIAIVWRDRRRPHPCGLERAEKLRNGRRSAARGHAVRGRRTRHAESAARPRDWWSRCGLLAASRCRRTAGPPQYQRGHGNSSIESAVAGGPDRLIGQLSTMDGDVGGKTAMAKLMRRSRPHTPP